MERRKILFMPRTGLSQDILSDRARTTLNDLGEVVWNDMDRDYTPEEYAVLLPGADAVVTSWGTPAFTPALLDAADRLKIVGHAAGSVKHLMPKAGYDRGVVVLSAAAVIADSVAEYTLWAMLSMQRDLYGYHADHEEGPDLVVKGAWIFPRAIWQAGRPHLRGDGRAAGDRAAPAFPLRDIDLRSLPQR